MGALPKRKTSHARQGKRRSHHRIKVPQLGVCPHCHQPVLHHHACPSCGYYRGRQIIEVRTPAAP